MGDSPFGIDQKIGSVGLILFPGHSCCQASMCCLAPSIDGETKKLKIAGIAANRPALDQFLQTEAKAFKRQKKDLNEAGGVRERA